MEINDTLNKIIARENLGEAAMQTLMNNIMTGQLSTAQIGAILIGLRMKGESVDEITGAVKAMRALSTKVEVMGDYLVDTCGTGGDSLHTFNISTCTAFVAAAAGCQVAKHGSRSVTSQSGSADLLEAAGVNINLAPEQVARCIQETGLGFMFAPAHHSAMKHAVAPRKELGTRTLFNILGPLTNPASAPNQVLGVFDQALLMPLAQVLNRLESEHVLVVAAQDGLDEISIASPTEVVELKNGEFLKYQIKPESYGMHYDSLSSIQVSNAQQSLEMITHVLDGQASAAADIVILNSAAAIYAANVVSSYDLGVEMAKDVLASGQAKEKLKEMKEFTQSC